MKPAALYNFFATCPKGLHYALEQELKRLGGTTLKPTPAGVEGEADLSCVYRMLLWSRIANRIIVQLVDAKINTADDIYALVSSIPWQEHFSVEATFAVNFLGTNDAVNNSTFGALKVKDAIVDQFRQETGSRPSVSKTTPDIRVTARLNRGRLSVGLDLSGESLHKRGYRSAAGQAPMKENLAAGLLELSGWPEQFAPEAGFIDPMCGSGTLLIEAAMSLVKKAPGLDRQHWGFDAWRKHDPVLWRTVVTAAEEAYQQGRSAVHGRLVGFDADGEVISRAWQNIKHAGLQDLVHVEKRALSDFELFEKMQPGLLLTNPPYGARLGEVDALGSLYQLLGLQFERHLLGWRAGVFTGNPDLGRKVAWRSYKQYKLYNGAIESQLLLFQLDQANRFKEAWQPPAERIHDPSYWKITHTDRAEMLKNRLLKNLKSLGKWADKQNITCFRLYDADMPEFSFAIDVYQEENGAKWLHLQEYKAPKSIAEAVSLERLREALAVIHEVLSVPPERMVLKQREIQKGSAQYEKNAAHQQTLTVREYDARLLVNLTDYLDTGLFLDHRPMRRWVRANVKNKRFLNLFCYTGAVTVSAALGGARETVSVDLSRTYLTWAKENLQANGIELARHQFIQQDCIDWLDSAPRVPMFDLIFLDPPSFSNSKRMDGVLDIQRDHVALIEAAMKRLAAKGQLLFSTNLRKFKFDPQLENRFWVTDMTPMSLDKDFERNNRIHQCWLIASLGG